MTSRSTFGGECLDLRSPTTGGVEPGPLDGLTIFRFAHMFRNPNAGGMERYLDDLNRRLLARNKMRILQMYLTSETAPLTITVEQVGRGELVWIPSTVKQAHLTPTTRARRLWRTLKRRLTRDPFVRHDFLLSALQTFAVKLAVFHWISEDSRIVLRSLASVLHAVRRRESF